MIRILKTILSAMYSAQRTMNFSYSAYSSITHYLWLSSTSCVGPSVLYRNRAKRCKSNIAGNEPLRSFTIKETRPTRLMPIKHIVLFLNVKAWVQRRIRRNLADGGLLRYRKWVPQQLGDVADMKPTNAHLATMSRSARWRYQARSHLEHIFW